MLNRIEGDMAKILQHLFLKGNTHPYLDPPFSPRGLEECLSTPRNINCRLYFSPITPDTSAFFVQVLGLSATSVVMMPRLLWKA